MSATESDLLRRIAARSASLRGRTGIAVGPGDDCAVVGPFGPNTLLTVDQLVEGRHFVPPGDHPDDQTVRLIARKAVARCISDIAAMGGAPRMGVAAGALRDSFAREDALFDALHHWGEHWGCPLVGGDIARTAGPTVLTITAIGEAHASRGPVLRSAALPGDAVYVTGLLGGSFHSGRHLTFEPRLAEGSSLGDALGARLHAMMDLSDGLGRDAARIASASAVRIEIDAAAIPMHPDVRDWRAAASDGEDYELLFTASGAVPEACPATGVRITRVGRVVGAQPDRARIVAVEPGGQESDIAALGWDHAP